MLTSAAAVEGASTLTTTMRHDEFKIGMEFRMGEGVWRVTDIGTRTVIAIRIDQVEIEGATPESTALSTVDRAAAEAGGWFNGPPYAVMEPCWTKSISRLAGRVTRRLTIPRADGSTLSAVLR